MVSSVLRLAGIGFGAFDNLASFLRRHRLRIGYALYQVDGLLEPLNWRHMAGILEGMKSDSTLGASKCFE